MEYAGMVVDDIVKMIGMEGVNKIKNFRENAKIAKMDHLQVLMAYTEMFSKEKEERKISQIGNEGKNNNVTI